MVDIAIIGAGIVGAAAAYELSQTNAKVLWLEKENDVSCGATKANSAIVHAGFDPPAGTLMARLGLRGNQLTAGLCQSLDVPYRQTGSLVLAFDDDDREHLNRLLQNGRLLGVPGLSILSAEQTLSLEPRLNPSLQGALYAPQAGVFSPWELCLALGEAAVLGGVDLQLSTELTGLAHHSKGFWELHTNKGVYAARCIINAAGVGAAHVQAMAGAREFESRPSRGQYYLLDKSQGDFVSHVIFGCPTVHGKGVLIAPTVHGNLIVGPSAEAVEDGGDVAVTADGLAAVAADARRLAPGVFLGDCIRTFAGVRAASDREDFIIGPSQTAPDFLNLSGIKSPGLTAAPAIAEEAIRLLAGMGFVFEQKRSKPRRPPVFRFRDASPDERARKIQEDPAFGRVVCRCETVTEGEILACMKRPIPPVSVDGVKRRTNAGMGRCQGGFCGARVLPLLAEATGRRWEDIPLDKEGSLILMD